MIYKTKIAFSLRVVNQKSKFVCYSRSVQAKWMAASFKHGILIVKITEVQNIIFNISKKSTNVVCSIKIAREKERERSCINMWSVWISFWAKSGCDS